MGKIPCLQRGQTPRTFTIHPLAHFSWKICLHGRTFTWSFSLNSSKQIEHSTGSSPSLFYEESINFSYWIWYWIVWSEWTIRRRFSTLMRELQYANPYITAIEIHTITDSWKKEITMSRKLGADKITSPVELIASRIDWLSWRRERSSFPALCEI